MWVAMMALMLVVTLDEYSVHWSADWMGEIKVDNWAQMSVEKMVDQSAAQ